MKNTKEIDITFDMRSDSDSKDPDSHSKTLKMYHKLLWSKELPNGKIFILEESKEYYLYHKSELGEYKLSSDTMIATYSKWKRSQSVIEQISKEVIKELLNLSYTIAGFIIFPVNKINDEPTINMERGTNPYINDRIDLTLECIRRYYINEKSPLTDTLKRYESFFDLFVDFKSYCEYFLLQDLVTDDYKKIKFFLPFNDFKTRNWPENTEEYYEYKQNNMDFLNKRNKRMYEYSKKLL